eukprot:CAMPEP_0119322934 /NCGR_PEP_ID=MMETSP1333-20130426/59545_1 /TAXON_ID=418940 /ORGANISM="Scyphosphaera apsteinii, Strain RCC1455" /LENGTH=53 /DNA_ID=CAMNT_0007330271 /DNA_START=158 /DNA_END=319 /DNA_ORIENTATION=+
MSCEHIATLPKEIIALEGPSRRICKNNHPKLWRDRHNVSFSLPAGTSIAAVCG